MEELLSAMAADGVVIPNFQPDGKMHRDKASWAIGFRNTTHKSEPFYVALYGDWSKNLERKFKSTVKLSRHDQNLVRDQMATWKKLQAKTRLEENERAALAASAEFDQLPAGVNPTGYMKRKLIPEYYGAKTSSCGWDLVVPLRDADGKLWSTQTIQDSGTKLLYPNGRKAGCFHLIGDWADAVYICEGFATAASVHQATGKGAVVAFDCGNLKPVAEAIRAKRPELELVIVGDDDAFATRTVDGVTEPYNAGRQKAEALANDMALRVVIPVFEDPINGQPTDFNDLHARQGLAAVADQLRGALVPAEVAWVAETQSFDDLVKRDLTVILPHWNWSKPSDKNPESKETTPMGTVENLVALFGALGVTAKYNQISKAYEVEVPGLVATPDNKANVVLTHLDSLAERIKMPSGRMGRNIEAVCDANAYNPIGQWIESKPWDQVDRLPDFYATVTAVGEDMTGDGLERQAFKEKLLRAWLIQAVAAVYNFKGVSAAGILVFLGDQYLGKTRWFKKLLPDDLAAYRADGVTFNVADKDSVFNVVSHWLVELGELDATFRKSDIAQLKAFVTKDRDKLRRPYAKVESEYPRRTVFFASVNEPKFLTDPTGNRRFWTIECAKINHGHDVDMQQVWAQVKTLYDQGEGFYLTPDEVNALNEHNNEFEQVNPFEELIRQRFQWDNPLRIHMTATQVCQAIDVKISSGHREPTIIANVLRKKFGLKSGKVDDQRCYGLPPIIRWAKDT